MALVTGPVAFLQLSFLQMVQGDPERVPGEGGAGGARVLGGAVYCFNQGVIEGHLNRLHR